MKATHLFSILLGLVLVGVILFAGSAPAEGAQYRTDGFSTAWRTWTSGWYTWTGTTWAVSGPPGPNDSAWVQCQMRIPVGYTATVGTLYVGCNNATNGGMAGGWYFHGPGVTSQQREHELEVLGTLNVNLDLYVVDDTFDIQTTGVANVTGICYIGLGAGYLEPPTGTQLDRRRASEPTLEMNGGTLNVFYGNTLGTQSHAGGIICWPGCRERLNSGDIHVEGWFVGANDTGITPNRLFDAGNGTTHVYMDGTGYPAGWTANAYTWDQNNASQTLKLNSLTVDRTGGRRVSFNAHVDISESWILLNGQLQAPALVQVSFLGNRQGLFTSIGNSTYSNFVFNMDQKAAQITMRSTIFVPGFTINNPNSGFQLFMDDNGVLMGFLQILDGRVFLNTALLEIHGFLQVGQQNPPIGAAPFFDLLNAGRVWVRGILAGPQDGDFYFSNGAGGTFNAGTLDVEGEFAVDNAGFIAGGSNTVILSGNVGRLCRMWNNQVPGGKIVATLILNNLTIDKQGAAPGNQVDILSDVEINGNLSILSGILNGIAGWTVYLNGQWPQNPPMGSGQGFTGNTALEIRTKGRFVLPGGMAPLIRVNKNDDISNPPYTPGDERCELGGNMTCTGFTLWDGLFDFMGFTLTVNGDFTGGSGNAPVDQFNAPTVHMVATNGGGGLDINSTAQGNGSFILFNFTVTLIDSGRIDVDGDIKIDANNFAPGGTNVVRITGNRTSECEMWSNKPVGNVMLSFQNFVFMKTGTLPGARMNIGSPVEVLGTFTMVSGTINGSLPMPFNNLQVLHVRGSPNAWAGTGGSYTNIHNNNTPPFLIMIDGTGDQTCFTGQIVAPDIPPDITIDKSATPPNSVNMGGGILHGSLVFVNNGTLDVGAGALIAEVDLFVGSIPVPVTNTPRIRMNNLNSLVEVRQNFYFSAGAVEEISDGTLRILGDMRVTDNDSANRALNFDLFDLGTETIVVQLTGSASGTAEIFRSLPPPQNLPRPLELFDLVINKDNQTDLVEAYSDINVNGSFTVMQGTVATPGGVINIKGNWLTSANGAYDPNANLALAGSGTLQTITAQTTLPNIRVDKPQSAPAGPNVAVIPTGSTVQTQTFWVRQGTLRLNGGTLDVEGDFIVGGNAVTTPATLEITQATGGGTLIVHHPVGASGSGNFFFNGGNGETAVVDSGRIRVTGRFAVGEATFSTTGTNVVELHDNRGSRAELWNSSAPMALANLLINKSGAVPGNQVDLISDLVLADGFQMIQGIFNTNNFSNFQLGGDWAVSSGCIFLPTVSEVEFTGTAGTPATINIESTTCPFYDLLINMPAGTDVVNYVSSNGRDLQVNRKLQVMRGEYTVAANATVDVGSGSSSPLVTLGDQGTPTADGRLIMSPGSTLRMANNTILLVEATTGTLRLLGQAGSPVTMTSDNPGTSRFDFIVQGTFEAEHYEVISPMAGGLQIMNTATLIANPNNLSNGKYDYPAGGGQLLDLSAMQSTAPLPLAIRACDFSNTNAATSVSNIKGSNLWTAGNDMVYLLQSTGNLAGETLDDDPGDSVIQDGFIRWSVGTVDVTLGPADPGSRAVLRQAGSAPVMQVHVQETSTRQAVDIETVTFTEIGTGNPANITAVDLYEDSNGDGQVTGGESLLGTGVYAGSPPRVTIGTAGVTLTTLPASGQKDLLLVYTFGGATPSPSVFQPSIQMASHVTGQVTVGAIQLPADITGAFPLDGGQTTVRDRGAMTIENGPFNPISGQIITNMPDASMHQIQLTAGTEEDMNVEQVTVTCTGGNGAAINDLFNIRLCWDQNNDGFFSAEPVLGTVANWGGAPWTATFTGGPTLVTVPAGQSRSLLVVCDVANVSPINVPPQTYRTSIVNAGALQIRGAVSSTLVTTTVVLPDTYPVDGNVQTLTNQPALSAIVGPASPGSRGIDKSWTNVPMLQVRLVGLGDSIDVDTITFNNSGSCNTTVAVSGATLVKDVNANGVYEAGTDILLGTTSSMGATIQFTLTVADRRLLANQPANWLLCYDFNGNGTSGTTLTASLPQNGVLGSNVNPPPPTTQGPATAVGSGTVTLLQGVGTLVVYAGNSMPAATFVSRSAIDKEMVQIRLVAGPNEGLRVTQMVVQGSG
ncbi:MAG: hypothetical protein ACYS47_05205, partial [Planctomycetota bacterium]